MQHLISALSGLYQPEPDLETLPGIHRALRDGVEVGSAPAEANRALADFAGGEQARCPRCASAGSDPVCSDCGLRRLIFDGSEGEGEIRMSQLPAPFSDLFQRLLEVIGGKLCLDDFFQELDPLAEMLSGIADQSGELEPVISGLELIYQADAEPRISLLQRGWGEFFLGLEPLLKVG